jgi:hypothetical protein
MRTSAIVAALLLVGTAGAQERQQQGQGRPQQGGADPAIGSTSDAFNRACVDLLNGRMPEGEKAIKTLKDACASLMAGRADERIQAEQRHRQQLQAAEMRKAEGLAAQGNPEGGTGSGSVEPGRGTAQPQEGTGVQAALAAAGSELVGPARGQALGMRTRGPVSYSLVTNPVGWFNGLGVNAELFGAIKPAPKFSWSAGARYSQTDASNGEATTFGAMGGVDWFIIGQNNEGLRVGPRLEVAAGREEFEGDTTFARLGLGGEVGYNFVATNGVTGLVAGGLGGRVAGDEENEDFASFVGGEFGPYLKFGLGYSW